MSSEIRLKWFFKQERSITIIDWNKGLGLCTFLLPIGTVFRVKPYRNNDEEALYMVVESVDTAKDNDGKYLFRIIEIRQILRVGYKIVDGG